jgi:hypothetical protein
MFLALWEFDVKPGCDERFKSARGLMGIGPSRFGATLLSNELSCCRIPSVT